MKTDATDKYEQDAKRVARVRSSRWLGDSRFMASPEKVAMATLWVLIATLVLIAFVTVAQRLIHLGVVDLRGRVVALEEWQEKQNT